MCLYRVYIHLLSCILQAHHLASFPGHISLIPRPGNEAKATYVTCELHTDGYIPKFQIKC